MYRIQVLIILLLTTIFGIYTESNAFALSVLKEVRIVSESRLDLVFDSAIAAENIRTDAFQQIIQFSIENASIYPAKIKNLKGSWSKLFIYQYSPTLVRFRLTVEGSAEEKVKALDWKISNRTLVVELKPVVQRAAKNEVSDLKTIEQKASAQSLSLAEQKIIKKLHNTSEDSQEKVSFTNENKIKSKLDKTPLTGNPPQMNWRKNIGMLTVVLALFLGIAFVFRKVQWFQGKGAIHKISKNQKGGVFGAVLSLFKRSPNLIKGSRQDWIKPLATHVLGPQQSISVVKVGGRTLVLGVTADSIKLISQVDSESMDDFSEFGGESDSDRIDFSEVLIKADHAKTTSKDSTPFIQTQTHSASSSSLSPSPSEYKARQKRKEPVAAPMSLARQRIQDKLGGLKPL